MSATAPAEIELPPSTRPQMAIWAIDEQDATFIDVEGSPRSAKSWGIARWIWKLAYKYRGINIFYSRYREQNLSQLREVWGKVAVQFPAYLHPAWNAKDQCWDFPNGEWLSEDVFTGSRVYLSPIKSSDLEGLHAKYKGKTLAVIIVEEAQELPYANYVGMQERLSQSRTPEGEPYRYPLKLVLVHNCVDEDHWIATEFPLTNDVCERPQHAHIRADLYSNSQNLGPDVMAVFEHNYPPGHVLRRTVIEGRRGVSLVGKPVYGGYFDRRIHRSDAVHVNPYYPLLEGWDFGHEKPAVVWMQYLRHQGAIQIVGAVKGVDMFLETFAPAVLKIRARWFPHQTDNVLSWCDPAGATGNGGTLHTPVRYLQELGVPVRYEQKANDAEIRYAAIQVMAGYMERLARDASPAFQLHPQCIELVKDGPNVVERPSDILTTAFEVGYIWDDKALSDAHPNIRKPKKGTRYDDLMNAAEYVITGESISVPLQADMLRAEQRLALVAQKLAAEQYERTFNRAAVGPTGETLLQATARIAAENKRNRDQDRSDPRWGKGTTQSRRGRF
jgi:hypothetical protein